MAEQGNKAAEGCVSFGNYILGVPEIERDQGNTEEGLQAAEEGSEAAEGRDTAGRPILGMGRGISGNFILGTPEI